MMELIAPSARATGRPDRRALPPYLQCMSEKWTDPFQREEQATANFGPYPERSGILYPTACITRALTL